MGQYRLLANSMWVGEKGDHRAKRGDVVEVDDKRAELLISAGSLVKHGEETDEQKKEFEGRDTTAEKAKADREEIEKQEQALLEQSGKPDNATKEKAAPAAAPAKSSSDSK